MKLQIISLASFLFIFGCSDKVHKNSIDLMQYLPNGNVGTSYISFFTHTSNTQVIEKKRLLKKQNNVFRLMCSLSKTII